MFVVLKRQDGSDGDVSCRLRTNLTKALGGKIPAIEGKDFEAIDTRVTFKHSVIE